MATILDVCGAFIHLDLLKECQIAIGKTKKAMIKAQQKQRWERGTTGKGEKMRPYRNPIYRELKIEAGHNDVTDLNLTGETDRKMFVDVDDDNFTIDSTGELVPQLEAKYGPDIYGLDTDAIGEYIESDFAPQLYSQIEAMTGIKMK